ncbi:MAG: hypothetical protein UY58_C0004G0033, partial [Candidatus Magasanikbacteria bacterium GW2011_GWA2_50_22]
MPATIKYYSLPKRRVKQSNYDTETHLGWVIKNDTLAGINFFLGST